MCGKEFRDDVLFIPVDSGDSDWKTRINDHHVFYVEKATYHDPAKNTECNAFAPFTYNENVFELIDLLQADEWIVYGNGLELCMNDVVIGLLSAGQKVSFLSDVACGNWASRGILGSEKSKAITFKKWEGLGATNREYAQVFNLLEKADG
jgi:hypothetical protein